MYSRQKLQRIQLLLLLRKIQLLKWKEKKLLMVSFASFATITNAYLNDNGNYVWDNSNTIGTKIYETESSVI